MQVRCPSADSEERSAIGVDHVKLFRNLPSLRFDGRIHEQILPAILRAGGKVAWTDLFVEHSGSDQSPEGRERKRQRDLRLLHLEQQDRPEHPFTLFNLGMTYADACQYERAVEFLTRSITRSGPNESHVRKAYALLVQCHKQLGNRDAAWNTCQQGLQLFPQDTELRFRSGNLLYESGRLAEAAGAASC
jgi:tetratricopeptide (TPR) repeat protein